MSRRPLTEDALRRALSLRDLTDPSQGPHAMQHLLRAILAALGRAWDCPVQVHRASPVVTVQDNYDRLHYAPDGVARDERYTRYVTGDTLLRTQTSAMIPPLLGALALQSPRDVLLACPGLVYRRDSIDRLHTGEPHQVDLWRIRRGPRLGRPDLLRMIEVVAGAALPGAAWRVSETGHPYTEGGLQIDVEVRGEWVEIGECGLALPALLDEAGLGSEEWSGLAMGLGLDRLLMLRKGVDDIRLLRAEDPRIASQLLDLAPYREVSMQPPIRRDLSIAVGSEASAEILGDRVRGALGERARGVEAVEVLSVTEGCALPPQAVARLGLRPGQKNVLLRVTLRDPERTLTATEANELRDRVYAALHEGDAWQWAAAAPGAPR